MKKRRVPSRNKHRRNYLRSLSVAAGRGEQLTSTMRRRPFRSGIPHRAVERFAFAVGTHAEADALIPIPQDWSRTVRRPWRAGLRARSRLGVGSFLPWPPMPFGGVQAFGRQPPGQRPRRRSRPVGVNRKFPAVAPACRRAVVAPVDVAGRVAPKIPGLGRQAAATSKVSRCPGRRWISGNAWSPPDPDPGDVCGLSEGLAYNTFLAQRITTCD